jgi:transcriptional regulator with XRE-family HTH domain
MMSPVNELQSVDLSNLFEGKQRSTNLNSRTGLIQRLTRGASTRAKFVDSHVSKTLAFQIRSLREKEEWSQQTLAEKIGSNQNAIYRAENPNYGKQTITTLKKIAAAFDVALIVRFVPFGELVDWVSGTPRTIKGLTTEALTVPSFEEEKTELESEITQTTAAAAIARSILERQVVPQAERHYSLAGATYGDTIPAWESRLDLAAKAMEFQRQFPQLLKGLAGVQKVPSRDMPNNSRVHTLPVEDSVSAPHPATPNTDNLEMFVINDVEDVEKKKVAYSTESKWQTIPTVEGVLKYA